MLSEANYLLKVKSKAVLGLHKSCGLPSSIKGQQPLAGNMLPLRLYWPEDLPDPLLPTNSAV